MIVTIHQPEHLPWLGFFDKIRQADVWVVLDHVQYRKNYFQHRNRILGDLGPIWITVPVLGKGRFGQPMNAVRIDNETNPRWRHKCWSTIVQHYGKAPYFQDHQPFFADLYGREWTSLAELNETIIEYLIGALGFNVRRIRSSELGAEGARGDLLLRICQEMGATTYLSGISGREYLDFCQFAAAGIEVRVQEFHHPVYRQLHQPFVPCLSAIDLLFNCGPGSLDAIRGEDVETLEHVFE